MEENLKRKTTKALVWSTADKLGQQLFYLVAGIILARQLSPEDYGKVGVLTIFIALSGILIDSGFSSALIRKKECGNQLRAVWFVVCSSSLYCSVF